MFQINKKENNKFKEEHKNNMKRIKRWLNIMNKKEDKNNRLST